LPHSGEHCSFSTSGTTARSARRHTVRAKFKCVALRPPLGMTKFVSGGCGHSGVC
jgi:hypothetical protein